MSTTRALEQTAPSGVLAIVRNNWMIALAAYPMVRFLLLAEAPGEMSGFQLAERFMWLSIWPIELAIILTANSGSFSLGAALKSFGLRSRALLVVWIGALGLSSHLAPDPAAALPRIIEWLMHAYAAISAWHLLSGSDASTVRQFDRFVRLTPWVTAAVGGLGLMLVYRIGLDSGYPFTTELPGFAHIRHTGYFFAPAMVLAMAQVAASQRTSWQAMAALMLNTAFCLWFGSRGPVFGLACGLIVAFALFADFRKPATIARIGGATVAGAVASVVVPSPEGAGFNAVMRLFNSSADPTAFSSGRLKFWEEALAFIADRPVVGYGSGQFQHVVPVADNMFRHPHNFVLQVLFDWGLVGGGAFLALLALAFAAALRGGRRGTARGQLGIFGAASMIGFALLDGIFFYPYTIFVTAVVLILALPRAGAGQLRDAAEPKSPAAQAAMRANNRRAAIANDPDNP